jgi:hypothetical protein
MANFNGVRAFACLAILTLAVFVHCGAAHAADAGPVPGPGPGVGGGHRRRRICWLLLSGY